MEAVNQQSGQLDDLHYRDMLYGASSSLIRQRRWLRDRLRWEWEVPVPELERSVFVIPRQWVKNREDRLVVLNDVAWNVVNERRGAHREFVFAYKGHALSLMNNSAWKSARQRAGLTQVRIHDLKHTFGRRLRGAGVSLETRKVLLGHRNGDITTHYSAPELQELLDAANKVCRKISGKIPSLTLIRSTTVPA